MCMSWESVSLFSDMLISICHLFQLQLDVCVCVFGRQQSNNNSKLYEATNFYPPSVWLGARQQVFANTYNTVEKVFGMHLIR